MNMQCERQSCDEIRRQSTLESTAAVLAESAEALGWDRAAFHVDIGATDLPRTRNGSFIAEMMGWPSPCLHGWRRPSLKYFSILFSRIRKAARESTR